MTLIKSNLSVDLEGRGQVTIRPSNYLATGGEGSVYRLNDTIVKLFTDPQMMNANGYGDKLRTLSKLHHKGIVAPHGLVRKNGKEIGYYMPYIDAEPLSRMFTNDFIVRNGITKDMTLRVVKEMRDIVSFAHSMQAVLVDANELNWLVQLGALPEPYVIDVDSWAIGNWKGKVIMPSIRDYHTNSFDYKSDWFAWGVVTFQLFTGIHPYKGTLAGFERGALDARMKANASVFSKGVKLNHAVRDFSLIPKGLYAWYEATFQKGERAIPPTHFDEVPKGGTIGTMYRTIITSKGALRYTKLLDGRDEIVNVFPCGLVALSNGDLYDLSSKKVIGTYTDRKVEIIEFESGYIIAEKSGGSNLLRYLRKNGGEEKLGLSFAVKKFVRFGNRLFAVTENGLTELAFHAFAKILVSAKRTWSALPYASVWYEGFGIQNALGACYLILPQGEDECMHIRAKELDHLSIISATRSEKTVSLVILSKKGEMERYDLVFSKDLTSYTIATRKVDTSDILRIVLPTGVSVEISEDGELEVGVVGKGEVKVVEDKDILSDGKLYTRNNTVLYARKGVLYSLSMT